MVRNPKSGGHALCFSPSRFPPKPERLLRLIELLSRMGFSRLLVDWGGLFPWSLDERFQSRGAYTDQLISAADKTARGLDINLIPRLPLGANMSFLLMHPAYRHLRIADSNPDMLDPDAPGAAKFVVDLLEDVVSLTPEIDTVCLDPVPGEKAASDYSLHLLEVLLPALEREASRQELQIVMRNEVVDRLRSCVSNEVMKYVAPISPLDGIAGPPVLPPTLELGLDLLAEATGVSPEARDRGDLARSHDLRAESGAFCDCVSSCWQLIRSAKETLVTPPSLGYSPASIFGEVDTIVSGLVEELDRIEGLANKLEAGLDPLTCRSVASGWLESRIEPLREEMVILQSRHRQIGVWIDNG